MSATGLSPSYNTLTQAVAFGTLKRAALFFPRVFPAVAPPDLWTLRGTDLQMNPRFVRIMASLLARPGQEPAKDAAEWMVNWWTPASSCASRMEAAHTTALEDEGVAGLVHAMLYKHVTDLETIEGEHTSYRSHLIAMLKKLGLESPSLVLPEAVVRRANDSPVTAAQYFFGEDSSAHPPEPAHTLMLSLSDLGLAHTDGADWDQILEIRRDETAMAQLRNLRLFLHEHYAAKEKAYISDDLARRMAEHQGAARKHGLQLATGTITALMQPSSLAGLGIAALAGSTIGGATVGLSTAVVGAGLHVAKTGLDMLGNAQERQLFLEQHELAYVFQLRALQP